MVELSHDSRPIIGRGPPLAATFLALATASVALMVADVRYDQLGRVRGWLDAAVYPVERAIDLPFRAWDWLTGSFADRDRLRRENLELTGSLRLANLQLQRFEALEAENLRLREMRANSAAVAKRAMVASILNVDLDPFRHRVLLDKGAADGVFKGQAVLDAQGIFGQVWRVNARTSEVILISDAEHAIPVQSNRSGVRTIAVGTGDPSVLSLPFVTVESDLKQDDLLITTGMGGVFPPGYPVARVTKVERTAKATFAIVEARPTAALDRDREVLLVWFDAPAPGAPVRLAPTAAVPEAKAPPAAPAVRPNTPAPSATGAAPAPQPGAAAAGPPGTAPSEVPRPAAEAHAPPPAGTAEEPPALEAAPAGPSQAPGAGAGAGAEPATPAETPAPQPEPATTPPGGTR